MEKNVKITEEMLLSAICSNEEIRNILGEALSEKADHMLSVKTQKKSNKKDTERQKDNRAMMEKIIDFFRNDNTPRSCSELLTLIDWSWVKDKPNPQRISNQCTALVKANRLIRDEERNQPIFHI